MNRAFAFWLTVLILDVAAVWAFAQPRVTESRSLPTVVYVRDAACPHCQRFEKQTLTDPAVRKALAPYGNLRILDEFKDAEEARRLGYTETPAIILVNQDGTVLRRTAGYMDASTFLRWFDGSR